MNFRNPASNLSKGAARHTSGLSLVSPSPSLSQNTLEGLPPDLREQPELYRLVSEYSELAYKPVLTDLDITRISEIYELAEYDEYLDSWIKKIDDGVDPLFIKIRQQERISLQDFISEAGFLNAQGIKIERLYALAEKLQLYSIL
jgi:hypothetical protein